MPNANYSVIAKAAAALDIPLPAELVAAYDAAEALIIVVDGLDPSPAALHRATLDALADGRSIAGDKAVLRALTEHVVMTHGLAQAAAQRHDDMIAQALTDAADQLLDAFSAALRGPAEALVEAAGTGAIVTLDDAPIGDVSTYEKWLNARHSKQLWDSAVTATVVLLRIAHANVDNLHGRSLTFTEASDVGTLDEIRRTTTAIADVWTLAKAGAAPSLVPSVSAYMDRVTDAEAARLAAIARAAQAPERPPFQSISFG